MDPGLRLPGRRLLALLLFAAAVFWFARPVILPFAVAGLVAYAFGPYVDTLQARTGRSRWLVVALVYGTGVLIVGGIVLAFAGPVSRELSLLVRAGPDALTTALRQVLGGDSLTVGDRTFTVEELAGQLEAAIRTYLQTPEGAIRAAEQLLRGSLDVILVLIVTFYLLLDGARFSDPLLRFLSPSDRAEFVRVARRVHLVVGRWLRGQLVLVVLVAVIVTIVLGPILGLPYPLALGVLVGVLEVITFIGPIVAGVIVAIVALATGGLPLAAAAVVFLFVLRQIEDVLIMPNVLGRAVNLHPLVALFAVVVGSTAFGVVGTFLAVPVAAGINVVLHELFPAEFGALPDEGAAPAELGARPGDDAAPADAGAMDAELPGRT